MENITYGAPTNPEIRLILILGGEYPAVSPAGLYLIVSNQCQKQTRTSQ